MTNRIIQKTRQIRSTGGKILSMVIMIGDPDIKTTFGLVRTAVDVGVDVIELGIPISNPFLDSDVMRESMSRSLAFSCDYELYLKALGDLRNTFQDTPFEVMIYHDTVMNIGLNEFCNSLVDNDMDAVLVADGVFKGKEFLWTLDEKLRDRGVFPVRFIPDPFDPGQIDDLQRNAQGFIVVQTRADREGRRETPLTENKETLDEIRRAGVELPLVLAYGIRTPTDIHKCLSMGADGVLIGTVVLEAAHTLRWPEFKNFLSSLREATFPKAFDSA